MVICKGRFFKVRFEKPDELISIPQKGIIIKKSYSFVVSYINPNYTASQYIPWKHLLEKSWTCRIFQAPKLLE